MSQAIVGVRDDGSVRALFCIDRRADELKARKLAKKWGAMGRTVHRCSEAHAWAVNKAGVWTEPEVIICEDKTGAIVP